VQNFTPFGEEGMYGNQAGSAETRLRFGFLVLLQYFILTFCWTRKS